MPQHDQEIIAQKIAKASEEDAFFPGRKTIFTAKMDVLKTNTPIGELPVCAAKNLSCQHTRY